jgi:hypothetical protein
MVLEKAATDLDKLIRLKYGMVVTAPLFLVSAFVTTVYLAELCICPTQELKPY